MLDITKQAHTSAAIFSDTHGNLSEMRDVLQSQGPFDFILHLGDGVGNGEHVAKEFCLPCYGVCGNEDWDFGFPEERVLTLHTWSFLLVHGHQTEINPYQPRKVFDAHIRELQAMGKKKGAQGLFFGHTHRTMLELNNGIIVCNPGNHHPGSSDSPTFARLLLAKEMLTLAILAKKGPGDWVIRKQGWFERSSF